MLAPSITAHIRAFSGIAGRPVAAAGIALGRRHPEGTPSAVIQIVPSVLPSDWEEIRAAYGLRPDSPWLKLVAPVEPGGASAWADALLRGFAMPTAELGEMVAAAVATPAFRPYGVWDAADLVGGGNLFVHGPVAALDGAAILPSHRNQGAQSALIAARVGAAREAGCRWVVAETGKPAARRNWRWQSGLV